MSAAEPSNLQTPGGLQFFLQLSGHPSAPTHALECNSSIPFGDFIKKVGKLVLPYSTAENPYRKSSTPVRAEVTNIRYHANGRVHCIQDQDTLGRACATAAGRQYDRLQGRESDPLLLTFEVVYQYYAKNQKPGLWSQIKRLFGAKVPVRSEFCRSDDPTEEEEE